MSGWDQVDVYARRTPLVGVNAFVFALMSLGWLLKMSSSGGDAGAWIMLVLGGVLAAFNALLWWRKQVAQRG